MHDSVVHFFHYTGRISGTNFVERPLTLLAYFHL